MYMKKKMKICRISICMQTCLTMYYTADTGINNTVFKLMAVQTKYLYFKLSQVCISCCLVQSYMSLLQVQFRLPPPVAKCFDSFSVMCPYTSGWSSHLATAMMNVQQVTQRFSVLPGSRYHWLQSKCNWQIWQKTARALEIVQFCINIVNEWKITYYSVHS